MDEILDQIRSILASSEDVVEDMNSIREAIHSMSPVGQPVDFVRWVPIEKVRANDYNPNSVASIEMGLLYKSIEKDGYTQPVVTIMDGDSYVIVDGFHRYFTAKSNAEILERNLGRVPVVVIDKPINDRMASTIRHNRARGKHSINGMSSIVFSMLDNGWGDAEVCNELGMEPEELIRLKHITGFSKLFKDAEYSKAWESRSQIRIRRKYEEEHGKSSLSHSPKEQV